MNLRPTTACSVEVSEHGRAEGSRIDADHGVAGRGSAEGNDHCCDPDDLGLDDECVGAAGDVDVSGATAAALIDADECGVCAAVAECPEGAVAGREVVLEATEA